MIFNGLITFIFRGTDPGVPMREWMLEITLLLVTELYLIGGVIMIEGMFSVLANSPSNAFVALWMANVPRIE